MRALIVGLVLHPLAWLGVALLGATLTTARRVRREQRLFPTPPDPQASRQAWQAHTAAMLIAGRTADLDERVGVLELALTTRPEDFGGV